jgi:hypothetical protein
MGLGTAHLPFDWVRTTTAGVTHFVRNAFADFFAVSSVCDVPSAGCKVYMTDRHSFWHDDVLSPKTQEKLQRRIDRFLSLGREDKDLLFIRSVATTDELSEVEDLYAALLERFGANSLAPCRRVLLAIVVEGQNRMEGPIQHKGLPGVVFYTQPRTSSVEEAAHEAYCQAITSATSTALAVPEGCDPSAGFGLGPSPSASAQSGARLLTQGPSGGGGNDGKALNFFDSGLYSHNIKCFDMSNKNQRVDVRLCGRGTA